MPLRRNWKSRFSSGTIYEDQLYESTVITPVVCSWYYARLPYKGMRVRKITRRANLYAVIRAHSVGRRLHHAMLKRDSIRTVTKAHIIELCDRQTHRRRARCSLLQLYEHEKRGLSGA